jgi:hypothetical protein
LKTEFQLSYWQTIKHQIDTAMSPKFKLDRNALRQNTRNIAYTRQSRIALHNLLQNDSSVYQIRCGTDGALLRIGVNDFRTDSRDMCQIFTGNSIDPRGPHTMFDLEPSADGSFALRSVASGRFVKTVPPPSDNPLAPWKLVIGGSLIGSAEKFRFTEDGKLYSALMSKKNTVTFIVHFHIQVCAYCLLLHALLLLCCWQMGFSTAAGTGRWFLVRRENIPSTTASRS